ncbi:AAA family ATPase [Cupriavidus agavae]|uniref:ATPase family protein associated with various cellular activities (AAA) n=1 Tax=Cupriavidus agavae TaxID=1001822 RepID=A0A4Q7S9B1_9BURK|nr:ATP-binding protein [Cupriavidus agavae]RZT43071.1 ATPase family protein associated with various cellular activities (AAA) [Cupriavidus agavae]
MAAADSLKALLHSHVRGDDEQFYSIAMQLAASQARQGHAKLAQELLSLVEEGKERSKQDTPHGVGRAIPLRRPKGELGTILTAEYPRTRMGDLVIESSVREKLARTVQEQRNHSKLARYGLTPRRKLLLVGPPGTGKTMTASVLAAELGIPLFSVRLDGLITKFMGETAAKLRQVFDAAAQVRGVYFFDEFDAIGSQRGLSNDVGEIRRVLNSFLQLLDLDHSSSLFVAATNHPEILDYALFRRFDDVLEYSLPSSDQAVAMLKHRLASFKAPRIQWAKLADMAQGLSHADIAKAAEDAIKDALINDRSAPAEKDLARTILERKASRARLRTS